MLHDVTKYVLNFCNQSKQFTGQFRVAYGVITVNENEQVNAG